MIATIKFKLPEEQDEFDLACRSANMSIAIEQIGNEVFRPARKHGYSDVIIAQLLEKCGEAGTELIWHLEQKYYEILRENNALGD